MRVSWSSSSGGMVYVLLMAVMVGGVGVARCLVTERRRLRATADRGKDLRLPACAHASSSSTHLIAGYLQSSHASLILHVTCL